MPELIVLAVGLAIAALAILPPLVRPRTGLPLPSDAVEAAELRYRVALEHLADLERDVGVADAADAASRNERAAAEDRAVAARTELEVARTDLESARAGSQGAGLASARARRPALVLAGGLAALLLIGLAVPAPPGLAIATVIDEAAAEARAREEARQARIAGLLDQLGERPDDRAVISELADAYLEGSSRDDLVRGATALTLLVSRDPQDADALRRLITAYLRAEDYPNARAALASFEEVGDAPADVAFFRGLIALRGDGDADAAVAAFDAFLETAADDPRAAMVRALRAEALDAGVE